MYRVRVATASVIIASRDDPYRVFIADSDKHEKPVIPGGKVDKEDILAIDPDLSDAGRRCIIREAQEETGINLQNPSLIGVADDLTRDVRVVPFSTIKFSHIEPPLPDYTPDDTQITASYGSLDYIYTEQVDEIVLQDTEELRNLRFIDIRELQVGDLSAGHDIVVLSYREMLDNGWHQIHQSRLKNFDADGQDFLGISGDFDYRL